MTTRKKTQTRKAREWWCVEDPKSGYLNACMSKKACIQWKRLMQSRADEQFLRAKYRVVLVREVLPRGKK